MNFSLDSLLDEANSHDAPGADMDLWIAALSFKTLDVVPRPLRFVIEVVTHRADVWDRLLMDCHRRVWLEAERRGVALYMPNHDYACVRLYNYSGLQGRPGPVEFAANWQSTATIDTLRQELDSAAHRDGYTRWVARHEAALADATRLVDGRQAHTSVDKSIVISSAGGGCVACGAPATRHASSTLGTDKVANMLHLPLCETHFDQARQHPSVLDFASHLFSLDLDLPAVKMLDHVPDEMIEPLRTSVAAQLDATALPAVKRRNGWNLRFTLPSGWSYLLRMRTLLDYAYMLYDDRDDQRYRADSAPHHPEVPFFPDHEHAAPDQENVVAPSFLYGNPIWDAKRLKQAATELGAYGAGQAKAG